MNDKIKYDQRVHRGFKVKFGLWNAVIEKLNGVITMTSAITIYLDAILLDVVNPLDLANQVNEAKKIMRSNNG